MGNNNNKQPLIAKEILFLRKMGFIALIFFSTLALWMSVPAQETDTAEEGSADSLKIVNRYGNKLGSVDSQGNVLNISGILLGSVDNSGNIFNVSKINVGKVAADGSVLNQADTVLGSVNNKGEIFNVSGIKLGEVKGESDINRTGAAARLIIFK